MQREPENTQDKNAIKIERKSGEALSYVPVKHIPSVHKALKVGGIIILNTVQILGHYVTAVKKVIYHKVIVCLKKRGQWLPIRKINKYNSVLT